MRKTLTAAVAMLGLTPASTPTVASVEPKPAPVRRAERAKRVTVSRVRKSGPARWPGEAGKHTTGCRAPGLARREAEQHNAALPVVPGKGRVSDYMKKASGVGFRQHGVPRPADSYRCARRNAAKITHRAAAAL